jgi:L-ectoine synthase
MIIRRLDDVDGTSRDVRASTWRSRRMLVADDGVTFSLHETVIDAGTETTMWYRHHVEAVYCIEGRGRLVDLDRDTTHEISPGTLYVLDGHERHRLEADTEMRMVCVFDPPVHGDEVHDETGAYPLAAGRAQQ